MGEILEKKVEISEGNVNFVLSKNICGGKNREKLWEIERNIKKSDEFRAMSGEIFIFLNSEKCPSAVAKLIISIISQMLIGQAMEQNLCILVLAPSDVAVNIIFKQLQDIRDAMKTGK